MATLLQLCLPHCASPAIVSFPLSASPFQRRTTVKVAPKSMRLSICYASSEKGSPDVLPEEESTVRVNLFPACFSSQTLYDIVLSNRRGCNLVGLNVPGTLEIIILSLHHCVRTHC